MIVAGDNLCALFSRFVEDETHSEQILYAECINTASNSAPDNSDRDQVDGDDSDMFVKSENIRCECIEGNDRKCSLCVKRDNLVCNFCPMAFIDKNKIDHHLSTSHGDIHPANNVKRKSNSSLSKYSKKTKVMRPLKIVLSKASQNHDEKEGNTTDHNGDDVNSGFECKICLKICLSSRGLVRHSVIHKHQQTLLNCNYCTKLFPDDDTKERHVSKYHRIKSEACSLQADDEHQDAAMVVESSEVNKNTKNESCVKGNGVPVINTSELPKTKIFACSVCDELFDKKRTLIYHRRSHNSTGNFTCEHCEKKFIDNKLLRRHVNRCHRKRCVQNPETEGHRKKCAKSPEAEDPFGRWYINIDGQKHLKCDQCNYNSLWYHKGRFLEHYRIHTGEKPFTCDLCKKQFRTKTLLTKHVMYVHEGVKEHACDICGRRFSDKRYMEDHRRIHTGERPYVCDMCGKTFKQSASLFIHKELHKGLRKHHCDMCGKAFTTRSSLNIHIKRHKGERNFVCATCGKAFVDNKHLRDHMAVHSEERPFGCELCSSRFKLLKHLKQHGRTHNREHISP